MKLYLKGRRIPGNAPVTVELTEQIFNKGICYCGASRSGKTKAILQLADQLDSERGEITCCYFDTRRDFLKRYYRPGDLILSVYPESGYPVSEPWSIMAEAKADPNNPEDSLREICSMLYEDQIKRSSQPFFPECARDVTTGVLKTMLRNCGKYTMTNKEIFVHNIKSMAPEDFLYRLSLYPDLSGLMSMIPHRTGDALMPQTAGVLAEIRTMVESTFIGEYAGNGRTSIREFIRNPQGRSLFILFNYGNREASRSINRILIDMIIKECLSDVGDGSRNRVVLFLDEFALAGPSYITDALSFGAGTGGGLNVVAGIQNISQVLERYMEQGAKSILEGFGSIIGFHPNQKPTRQFIQDFFGIRYNSGLSIGDMTGPDRRGLGTPQIKEFPAVTDEELYYLAPGEAVIGLAGMTPMKMKFDLPEERCGP